MEVETGLSAMESSDLYRDLRASWDLLTLWKKENPRRRSFRIELGSWGRCYVRVDMTVEDKRFDWSGDSTESLMRATADALYRYSQATGNAIPSLDAAGEGG